MQLLIARDDLHRTRIDDAPPPDPAGGAVLRVDRFGMTANNITYAVMGDAMSYWNFFPAPDGWGRLPVWGYAEVTASEVDGLQTGTRVYGYLPAGSHLRVEPRPDQRGFVDAAEHRAALPSVYNRYADVAADPLYDPAREDLDLILRPLFITSFLLDAHLAETGAEVAVLSSASSRTSIAAAYLLARREDVAVVGLTSAGNVDFVRGLGVYAEVLPYEEVASLTARPTAYADVSGDGAVRSAVHRRLADDLVHSAVVGATHHDQLGGAEDLPGPRPTFFFAPDHIRRRAEDEGRGSLDDRIAAVYDGFLEWSADQLEVRHHGPDELEGVYLDVLDGRADPGVAHVIVL